MPKSRSSVPKILNKGAWRIKEVMYPGHTSRLLSHLSVADQNRTLTKLSGQTTNDIHVGQLTSLVIIYCEVSTIVMNNRYRVETKIERF
jgi:hypothetical protein